MEMKSLILGVGMSVGVFAIKTGIGMSYYLMREQRPARKAALLFGIWSVYGTLFAGAYLSLDLLRSPGVWPVLQELLHAGAALHLTFAVLMLIWGVQLLRSDRSDAGSSRGWLALVIPCPVCLTMIMMTVGAAAALFPETTDQAVGGLFFGFTVIVALTAGLAPRLSARSQQGPEHWLGTVMTTLAAYFLISLLVMPHFAELDAVSGIAARTQSASIPWSSAFWTAFGLIIGAFGLGAAVMSRKIAFSQTSNH